MSDGTQTHKTHTPLYILSLLGDLSPIACPPYCAHRTVQTRRGAQTKRSKRDSRQPVHRHTTVLLGQILVILCTKCGCMLLLAAVGCMLLQIFWSTTAHRHTCMLCSQMVSGASLDPILLSDRSIALATSANSHLAPLPPEAIRHDMVTGDVAMQFRIII